MHASHEQGPDFSLLQCYGFAEFQLGILFNSHTKNTRIYQLPGGGCMGVIEATMSLDTVYKMWLAWDAVVWRSQSAEQHPHFPLGRKIPDSVWSKHAQV